MDRSDGFLSVDPGTAFIRASRLSAGFVEGEGAAAELVDFGGAMALQNVACLSVGDSELQEVGPGVFTSGAAQVAPERVHPWIPLDIDPATAVGKVATLLWQEILRATWSNAPSEQDKAVWQTLVAVAPSYPHAAALEARLASLGFPAPRALDMLQAILAGAELPDGVRGSVLVIDCGAAITRVALYDVQDSIAGARLLHVGGGRPGGRDFDRVIAAKIRAAFPDINWEGGNGLELMHVAARFKEQFSRAWAADHTSYEAVVRIGNLREVFSLSIDDFKAPNVGGSLVASFEGTVERALAKAGVEKGGVAMVVLAGGGARWPFVQQWVKATFGPDRMSASQFPEERAVRGLLRLARQQSAALPDRKAGDREVSPRAVAIEQRLAPVPARKSSRVNQPLTFAIEVGGGVLGVLGLGWLITLGNVPVGCAAMLLWWIVIGVTVLTLGGAAMLQGEVGVLLLGVVVWLAGPVLSGMLASRRAAAHNRNLLTNGGSNE